MGLDCIVWLRTDSVYAPFGEHLWGNEHNDVGYNLLDPKRDSQSLV